MQRALWALAALGLMACVPVPPTSLAAPTPAFIRVLATDLTEPMLFDLGAGYMGVQRDVAVIPDLAAADAVPSELSAGRADLALVVAPDGHAPAGLYATPLGYLRLVVVVHPSLPITPLDAGLLAALFTGQTVDWAALGRPALPVQPVVRPEDTDAARLFAARVLPGGAPTVNARLAPTWDAMRALVAENPGAIGYMPASLLFGDGSVRAVSSPVDLRALVVAVATTEPTGRGRGFLVWAQGEAGQQIVARRHDALR